MEEEVIKEIYLSYFNQSKWHACTILPKQDERILGKFLHRKVGGNFFFFVQIVCEEKFKCLELYQEKINAKKFTFLFFVANRFLFLFF